MEFRILGPLAIVDAGRELPLGAAKQRALLALLLLHRNEEVASERLIDWLWAGRPPATAQKSLQVYVSGLRRALGEGRLVTRERSYLLRVEQGELDVDRFEGLVEKARSSDPHHAASLFREALSLYRGEPLAELRYSEFAQSEIVRLEELRLQTLEDRIDADLACGRERSVLAELEGLVASYPLRERLRAQLMLALYRSGRQADALAAYQQGRQLLDERLGLEPGPQLKELERQILAHDSELATRAKTIPFPLPGTGRLRMLLLAGAGLVLAAGVAAAVVALRGGGPRFASGNAVAVIAAAGGRPSVYTNVGTTPGNVVVGSGSVWVLNADDRTISRIDPSTKRVTKTFATGTTPTDLAVGDGALWVGNGSSTGGQQARFTYTATVSRVDPGSTAVTETVKLPGRPYTGLGIQVGLSGLAVGAGSVWAIDPDRSLARLDAATGALQATIPASAGTAIAAGNEGVWFLTSVHGEPAVARVDPRRNRIGQTVATPPPA